MLDERMAGWHAGWGGLGGGSIGQVGARWSWSWSWLELECLDQRLREEPAARARLVALKAIGQQGTIPHVITYNAQISACEKGQQPEQALKLLKAM